MKLKHLWLPMLLLTLIGGAAKICDTVFTLNGQTFFINSATCNFIFIGAIVLVLVLGFILSIADRKKNLEISPVKSIASGTFGFIASVAIIGTGVLSLLGLGKSTSFSTDLISSVLTLAGGAVLLFESCISFTGHNTMKKIPIVTLAVPLWCCSRLISLFMSYSKVSVQCTEMFDLIAVALLLMFVFYQSMFFAEINKSIAARKLVVYGMPFITSALVVTIDLIIKKSAANELTIGNILNYFIDIAFCGYAIFLMKNIFKSSKLLKETVTDEDEIENTDLSKAESTETSTHEVVKETVVETPTQEVVEETIVETPTQEVVEETVVETPTQEVVEETVVETPTQEVVEETVVETPTQEVVEETIVETPTQEVVEETVVETPTQEVVEETVVETPTQEVVEETVVETPTQEVVEETVVETPTQEVVEETVIETPTQKVVEKTVEPPKSSSDCYDIFKLLDEMSSKK